MATAPPALAQNVHDVFRGFVVRLEALEAAVAGARGPQERARAVGRAEELARVLEVLSGRSAGSWREDAAARRRDGLQGVARARDELARARARA